MLGSGSNRAITKDGGAYNKLQRPQNYMMPSAHPPTPKAMPPKATPPTKSLSETSASKRKREQVNGASKHKRARVEQDGEDEAHHGMRSLLPGLDDEGHTSDEGISEALAYLRDVRSEASAIPQLLVASTAYDHSCTETSEQAFFHEGTWIALDEHHADSSSDRGEEEARVPDPQDRLYELLLKRYQNLRATLTTILDGGEEVKTQNSLALADLADLLESERNSLYKGKRKSQRVWPIVIDNEFPTLDFMQRLDDSDMYSALDSCTNKIGQTSSISPQLSCWMWTLLASVGDVGTLDNWKISRIRDLGQKAGLLGMRLRNGSSQHRLLSEDVSPQKIKSTLSGIESNTTGDMCESVVEKDAGDAQEYNSTHGNDDAAASELPVEPIDVSSNMTCLQMTPPELVEPKAEMSVFIEKGQAQHGTDASEFEQARARLLAQLGDRLVQAQLPSPETSPKLEVLHDGVDYKVSAGTSSESRDDSADLEVDSNTRAAIDMVLTIVAECFGQKDLLEYRQRW